METWERPPPHRRSRSKSPSFSSSLLDAVLRSIDDNAYDGNISFPSENQLQPLSHCRPDWSAEPPVNYDRSVSRSCVVPDYRRRSCPRKGTFSPNSRSSSSSTTTATTSTAGFSSSSDAESARGSRIPRPGSPAKENYKNNKSKFSYIRGGLRGLRRGRTTTSAAATVTPPASPGARLARFLNSLLAAARSPKKSKISIPATGGAAKSTATGGSGGEGALARCPSASICRRSCMRKAHRQRRAGAEERKRSVRFYPVSVIVDEECRPCGHRRLHDDTVKAAAVRPVARRVEELLMAAGEEEEEDRMSEGSSDLFELENLTAAMEREGGRSGGGGGGGGGCGYRDELPLYETTDFNAHCAIAHDLTSRKNSLSFLL